MDYRDLECIVAIAATHNLARASEQLHLSPSSLSRRLAKMEEEVGICLVDRDVSPIQLTYAGQQLLSHAEQTLASWRQLNRQFHIDESDLEGSLTLFCSVTASYSVVADLLSRFRERYPGVDLHVHTGDAAESLPRLQQKEADVVVAARPEKLPPGLSFKPLVTSPLVFIAPKTSQVSAQLGAQLNRPEFDWGQIPMVLSETGLTRSRVDNWFQAKHIKPKVYAQVSGHEAIVSMVALGVGVGVVPEIVLRHSPMANRVRIMTVTPELEAFSIGLCSDSQTLQQPLLMALWSTAV